MKILYFAPIPFDGLMQRPQYLALELAKEHEVFYIEPTISLMKKLLKGDCGVRGRSISHSSTLHIIRLNGFFSLHRSLEALPIFSYNPLFERCQLHGLLQQCDLIWIGYCGWYGILPSTLHQPIVYDRMDDNIQLTKNRLLRKLLSTYEPKLISTAQITFYSASALSDDLDEKKSHYLPNAIASTEHRCAIDNYHCVGRKFGYIGMISHWFDFEAIFTILNQDEDNHVILVGPTEVSIPHHPRIHIIGAVPKNQVASWIASFDVCLYPFLQYDLLKTINPVKIYEYLGENKPVLASYSEALLPFQNLVYGYDSPASLMILLQQPLPNPFPTDDACTTFKATNTWACRGNDIRQIVHQLTHTEQKGL